MQTADSVRRDMDAVAATNSHPAFLRMLTLLARMPTMSLIALILLSPQTGGESLPEVVLLDFTAGYCQPCQEMVPIFQRMEQDHFPIRTIDITEQPQVARQHRVERIPTMILMVEGREVTRFVGRTAESKLRRAMNQAAKELDDRRQAAAGKTAENRNVDNEAPLAKRGPMNAIIGLFRKDPDVPPAVLRGQDPPPLPTDSTRKPSSQMAASVRINVADGNTVDVGSGTIIHSEPGGSLILTCGHLFDQASKDAKIQVEVFRESEPAVTYLAELVDYNIEADVGLIAIINGVELPAASLVAADAGISVGDKVVSTGCSDGAPPTAWPMEVATVGRYDGPDNFECTEVPAHGRSGGAVFNSDGRIIGVCSAAFKQRGYGLYAGHKPIYDLLRENDLLSVTGKPESSSLASGENLVEFETSTSDPQASAASGAVDADADWLASSMDEMEKTLEATVPTDLRQTAALLTSQNDIRNLARNAEMAGDAEVVCYIRSKDGSSAPRMIVIPKASPWLMDVLTGDTTAARIPDNIQTVSHRPVRRAAAQSTSHNAGTGLIPAH